MFTPGGREPVLDSTTIASFRKSLNDNKLGGTFFAKVLLCWQRVRCYFHACLPWPWAGLGCWHTPYNGFKEGEKSWSDRRSRYPLH
jgi:hypothetical protein